MPDEPIQLFDAAQIRVLLKLAETRSFSRTASALGVRQPTISQQIKRIETAIGRPIFRRHRTGAELTRDGEAVLVYARAIMGLSDDLRAELARNAGSVSITVGMVEDFSRTALPSVLVLFAQDYRNVELRVVSGTYGPLSEAIEKGGVDLAVLRRNARLPDLRRLWSDAVAWVGRADFPRPVADPVPLCLPYDSPARDAVTKTLDAAGRTWRIAFESNSLTSLEAALQARLGVGAFPVSMRHDIAALDGDSGLPALPDVEYVMHEPAADAPATVRAFAAVIRSAAESRFGLPGLSDADP